MKTMSCKQTQTVYSHLENKVQDNDYSLQNHCSVLCFYCVQCTSYICAVTTAELHASVSSGSIKCIYSILYLTLMWREVKHLMRTTCRIRPCLKTDLEAVPSSFPSLWTN